MLSSNTITHVIVFCRAFLAAHVIKGQELHKLPTYSIMCSEVLNVAFNIQTFEGLFKSSTFVNALVIIK